MSLESARGRILTAGVLDQGILTIYALHIILLLRLYGLYGGKRLVYGLSCLMLCAFGADICIVAMREPLYTTVSIPHIGVLCVPKSGDAFRVIWYVFTPPHCGFH